MGDLMKAKWPIQVFSVPVMLISLSGCKSTGSGGGTSSPFLATTMGPTVLGPNGATRLASYGSALSGPIQWNLRPVEAGSIQVINAFPLANGILAPTSPPPPANSLVAFHAGWTVMDPSIEASAPSSAGMLRSPVTVHIVTGIQVRMSPASLTLAPGAWPSTPPFQGVVYHSAYPDSSLPQRNEVEPMDDLKDGIVQTEDNYLRRTWEGVAAVRVKAPTASGTYRFRVRAAADPTATTVLTLVVQ